MSDAFSLRQFLQWQMLRLGGRYYCNRPPPPPSPQRKVVLLLKKILDKPDVQGDGGVGWSTPLCPLPSSVRHCFWVTQ